MAWPPEEPCVPEPVNTNGLESRCHGTGLLRCRCMGDGCCCGAHGEMECYGCEDCRILDDEWDDDEPDFSGPIAGSEEDIDERIDDALLGEGSR